MPPSTNHHLALTTEMAKIQLLAGGQLACWYAQVPTPVHTQCLPHRVLQLVLGYLWLRYVDGLPMCCMVMYDRVPAVPQFVVKPLYR